MISFDELTAHMHTLAREAAGYFHTRHTTRPTVSCVGWVLAEDVRATLDMPRSDVSAMDGYALATVDTDDATTHAARTRYRVVGEALAGQPLRMFDSVNQQNGDGSDTKIRYAIRITTGATVPAGYDTVAMQEETTVHQEQDLEQNVPPLKAIELTEDQRQGNNIRRAGEEVTQGEVLLTAGTVVQTQHISLLAAMGIAQLTVVAPIRVGLLASGDELVALGASENKALQANQIYDSNTPTLQAMLADMPVSLTTYDILPDDLDATCAVLQAAADANDVLISTAGVSVGQCDFLTDAVQKLGEMVAHKVAMKPGKPFALGTVRKSVASTNSNNASPDAPSTALFFGLPGNPVSVFVGSYLLVKLALYLVAGAANAPQPLAMQVRCTSALRKKPGRRDFQRGVLSQDASGEWVVRTAGTQQSHRIKGLAYADALIDLAADAGAVEAGAMVRVLPMNALIFGTGAFGAVA